jgi:DNA invertase Pin-like site-specific DNA recombinase
MTQAAAHWLWHEGISATRLRGVHKGRPASIAAAKVVALKAEGLGATEIAKRFKIGRASVYRVLASRGCLAATSTFAKSVAVMLASRAQ